MGITVNGPSGIDTQSLISQLVELEYTNKVEPVEKRRDDYDVKISAYSQFKSLISTLSSNVAALDSVEDFNLFSVSSSDEDVVTLTGGTGCQTGEYSISVFHKAVKEKIVSSDSLINSQSASLSSFGIQTGVISINGTEITIGSDDSIQDLRAKINNSTDEDGNSIGVTASVLKLSDSNFRLVLTSKCDGNDGVEYKDISGSTLQDLGIIVNSEGGKDISNQVYSSSNSIISEFDQIATGDIITISGSDHDGNEIYKRFVKTEGADISKFLKSVSDAFNGTVGAIVKADGTLQVSDKIAGDSKFSLSITNGSTNESIDLSCTSIGGSGDNILACGSNSFFSVDGINIDADSNKIDDVIKGATISLEGVSSGGDVTVSVNRDTSAIRKKIQDIVDAYNSIRDFVTTSTKMSTEEGSEDGDLAGDMTVSTMLSTISSQFRQQLSSLSGTYKNLTSLGIKTDYTTGKFSIDTDVLEKAIDNNIEDVINLFTSHGTSSVAGITLGRTTDKTQSAIFEIEMTEDNQYRIREKGTSEWLTGQKYGEVVTFNDGKAAGLSLTISNGTMFAGQVTEFNFNKGFSSLLSEKLDSLTDSKDGLITLKQDSLNSSKKNASDRIEVLETQIETYRERLVKQYAAMEQALSTMQSQMSDMLSSLSS